MMSVKKANMARKADMFSGGHLQGKGQDGRVESSQSPSRRHREKLNSELEELGKLLPLPNDVRSKLDKLSILRLGVSFFQIENFVSGEKKNTRQEQFGNSGYGVLKKLKKEGLCLSEAALEIYFPIEETSYSISVFLVKLNLLMKSVKWYFTILSDEDEKSALGAFFAIFTSEGDVFYVTENVKMYTGYTQTFLMHQNFLQFIDPDDCLGFRECIATPKEARIVELDSNGNPRVEGYHHRVCFCSIRCHAGRQSSHVSPFFYKSFKFDGYLRPVNVKNTKVKEYCYFAICIPSHESKSVGRSPRDVVPYYQIKVGLDYTIQKLDSNGQKHLQYSDKQVANIDAYLLFHPEDIPGMAQMHKHLIQSGKCNAVFRALTGKGIWRWVRGSARIVLDKKGIPEFVIASNWMVSDEEGIYYKKQLLDSFENEQPAITDGNEASLNDGDAKHEDTKVEPAKDKNSKPVTTKKSTARKSNKRKQRDTGSDDNIVSHGTSAQSSVNENISQSNVGCEKDGSSASSSPYSLISRQSSVSSSVSSNPEPTVAGKSSPSVSSSDPGSCEAVTSPENESGSKTENVWQGEGSVPFHLRNGSSRVSTSGSYLSSENSAITNHRPVVPAKTGSSDSSNAQGVIQEEAFPPNTECVAVQSLSDVPELRPSMSWPAPHMNPSTGPSVPTPQSIRSMQPFIHPVSQMIPGPSASVRPLLSLQQAGQCTSSPLQLVPQTTQSLKTSSAMSQDIYGVTTGTMSNATPPSVPPPAHSTVSVIPQVNQGIGPNAFQAVPIVQENQRLRPDMQPKLAALQEPQQPRKLSHFPQNVDPSVALQQEVNLSDTQLEALKKFLTNWDTSGGMQQATRSTPTQERSLESELGSLTADKLELLHSLLNGQPTKTVYQGEQPSVTVGSVSNGLMGQEIPQQRGIPQGEPITRSGLFGTEHSVGRGFCNSYDNPLNEVVHNTQNLHIDIDPSNIPPYTHPQQGMEDPHAYKMSSYQSFNQQLSTANDHDRVQQRNPYYAPVPITQSRNYLPAQNFTGDHPLNNINYAVQPSSTAQPELTETSCCFPNGSSLETLQQQASLLQPSTQPASETSVSGFGYQPVATTSNACEHNFASSIASFSTPASCNTNPDVIDLHSTKDLFVAPQTIPMHQQHPIRDAAAGSLPTLQEPAVVDQLMSSVDAMDSQVMGSNQYDDIDIPNIPMLEQILESKNLDNLLSNGQESNQTGVYTQGTPFLLTSGVNLQHNCAGVMNSASQMPGQMGNNAFRKPVEQSKQSQLLRSLLTNGKLN